VLLWQLLSKCCVDPKGIFMSTAAIAIIGDIDVAVAASTVQFE